MDVIVEGKITNEEGIDEVIQTLIQLKTVVSPVLRINCLDNRFQGKIGFTQDGYILGAKVDETGELGYPAVRRLLLVRNGNYAILDPGKQFFADINQSLWINAAQFIQLLPNLPESAIGLSSINSPLEIPSHIAEETVYEPLPPEERRPEKILVTSMTSKARQFDLLDWRIRYSMIITLCVLLILLVLCILQYSDSILASAQSFIQSFAK